MGKKRIKYLESLLPQPEVDIEPKYRKEFEKFARYLGNGIYSWMGIYSNDTRELWLMGVLAREGIEYEDKEL